MMSEQEQEREQEDEHEHEQEHEHEREQERDQEDAMRHGVRSTPWGQVYIIHFPRGDCAGGALAQAGGSGATKGAR